MDSLFLLALEKYKKALLYILLAQQLMIDKFLLYPSLKVAFLL